MSLQGQIYERINVYLQTLLRYKVLGFCILNDTAILKLIRLFFLTKSHCVMAFELTDGNFKSSVKENNVVVVDFWAEWCGPCRMVAPIIDELSNEYKDKALVGKLDVDTNRVATEFGIRSIPTIMIFKNGEVFDKHVGTISKKDLSAKIDKALGVPA